MIDDPTPLYPNDDLNRNNMCEQFKIDYWVNQRKSPTCNEIKYLNLKGQWPWKAAIYLCHGPEDLSLSDWAKHLKEELESFIKWTKLYPDFYGAYKFHTIIEVKENLDGICPLADVFQDETVVQIMRDLFFNRKKHIRICSLVKMFVCQIINHVLYKHGSIIINIHIFEL